MAPAIVHEVLSSSGQPLESDTRARLEARFGHSFAQVRVHSDSKAAVSARAVGAAAYTVGQHVVFGEGRYAPGTESGLRTLTHELVHTIQQPTAPTGVPLPVLAPHHQAELGAHRATYDTLAGQHPTPIARSPIGVARLGDPEAPPSQSATTELADPNVDVTQLLSSSGNPGGSPGPNTPDFSAWMGGRIVEHWLAGGVFLAQHTYINFKQDKDNYWLVEAGPLDSDKTKVGAWAKKGSWEGRGGRFQYTYSKVMCWVALDRGLRLAD